MNKIIYIILVLILNVGLAQDVFEKVSHHYADNEGVKIHYVSMGEGPVLIMLHGFPDFWYTWRHQMEELSKDYKVVAVDLRGYNKSDKPEGVENYTMRILMRDVIAVIDDLGLDKATLIANDWGGAIAWQVATYFPNRVERYIACNIPHSNGMAGYLRENPQTGQYARDFKDGSSGGGLTSQSLVDVHNVLNEKEKKIYLNAFDQSSLEGMLNYYKANYPSAPKKNSSTKEKKPKASNPPPPPKNIQCPVLMIYGMKDTALPPGMLNNTWEWVDNDLTILTIPEAGHFVQQEAAKKVTKMIRLWLAQYE